MKTTNYWQLILQGLRNGIQCANGAKQLSRIQQPIVTIFGGKEATREGPYAQQAYAFARLCVSRNMAILTGGGPGIMYSSNCGARDARKDQSKEIPHTYAIGVRNVDVDFTNKCSPVLMVDQFSTRKWLLTRYSCAFVIFPGGIGTMDELFEVLNLIKVKHIPQVPIILIGSQYWQQLHTWYMQSGHQEGFILPEYTQLFRITDNLEEALTIIVDHCQQQKD